MTKETADAQLKVRLSAGLKAALHHAAIKNGRSLNAEICARLQQSMDAGGDGVSPYAHLIDVISNFAGLGHQERGRAIEIITELGNILSLNSN